ncbi:MAG: ABC transporter substrate-binding protein [bacterium]
MEESAPAAPSSGRGTWIAVAAFVVGIVVGAAGVFGGGLLFPPAAEVGTPIVGTVVAVTGQLDIFGPTIRLAVDLAQEEINDAGGVLGQDIVVIHEDSQTAAAAGVTAASKLINVDGAQAIIGALASSVSTPINEGVTTPSRVVQISPASTSPAFTDFNSKIPEADRFFFRTAPSDALQGVAGALYAFNTKGWRDMAILARDDPYGSGLAEVFEVSFKALGGTITERVEYNTEALLFDTELGQIFDSGPEAIWWVAFPGEGELIMTQWWANTAWRGPEWFWSEGTKGQEFVDTLTALGIGVEGMEGTAPITALGVSDNFDTFEAAFTAATGKDLVLFEQHSYDALYLIALAMQMGGAVDSDTIRDNLRAVSSPPGTAIGPGDWALALTEIGAGREINYEGASGFANFDEFGDVGSDYEIWRISQAGIIEGEILRIPESDLTLSPPAPAYVSAPSLGWEWSPQAVFARD